MGQVMRARLIEHLGWVYRHLGSWESPAASRAAGFSCARQDGTGGAFVHRADLGVVDVHYSRWLAQLSPEAAARYSRNTLAGARCLTCGSLFEMKRSENPCTVARRRPVFATESGDPEPRDLYWSPWISQRDPDGRPHLVGICPDGAVWDIDGFSSDCPITGDVSHRCWIRHGHAPLITVNKTGAYTCSHGDGSVDTGEWHGKLIDGVWTPLDRERVL
jgi:hypothetical protein